MVSTRGVRYKFSEGERVLCYEPDPTKAKVLYDSKVLEVIESKDKRGRRTVEYLIHFQGWNSSWDRCVSEDFVLKDTEENRQLQRDLAEKSQLQLGAYLYRRERKKGSSSSTTGGGPAKRARHGFSDDGSSSSTTQPDEPDAVVDTDSSSGDGSGSRPRSPPFSQPGRASIPLPPQLRDRLTFDYHLVVKRGKLLRLPASPCAALILESFVKWWARAGAWNPPRGRHEAPQKPDLAEVSCRLNIIREVADGLRVYFDFILKGHLLYKQEKDQYQEVLNYIQENAALQENADKVAQASDVFEFDADTDGKIPSEMLSPTFPEFSHLPPFKDPEEKEKKAKNDILFNSLLEPSKLEPNDKGEKIEKCEKVEKGEKCENGEKSEKPATIVLGSKPEHPTPDDPQIAAISAKLRDIRATPALRSGNVARRLRSHKSIVSQSETEEPAPSTSTGEPRTFETLSSSVKDDLVRSMGSSCSSMSECWSRPTHASATVTAATRTPLSLLLDKVANWQAIPRVRDTSLNPCRIYGATHLARLFVKLPEFLNNTPIADYKLKLILKHIDIFVQFLEDHHEWFGETYYSPEVPEVDSRSH